MNVLLRMEGREEGEDADGGDEEVVEVGMTLFVCIFVSVHLHTHVQTCIQV